MKIAFLLVGKLNYGGGAEKWVKDVATYLLSKGHEVSIYVPYDKRIDSYEGVLKEKEIRIRLYSFFKALGIWNLYPPFFLPKLREYFDVIYVTSMNPFLFFALYRNRVISGTHDAFVSDNGFSIDSLRNVILLTYRLPIFNHLAFHTFSPYFSDKFRPTGKRIYEIPNYADVPTKELSMAKTFQILFLGRVERRKGSGLLFELCEKLKHLPEVEFYIAGKINNKYKSKANELNRYKNIKFLGFITDENKGELLSTASLFLFLSKRDTFPFTLLEALSHGIPVISIWKPAAQILRSGWVEIVDRDVDVLILNIMKKYDAWKKSKDEYHKIRKEIMEDTQKRYNKEKIMRDIERMFGV